MAHKEIRTAMVNRIKALLPAYKELHNIFNVEDNEERNLASGFAVKWGGANMVNGCTRHLSFNSPMVVSFTNKVNVRAVDNQAPDTGDLFDDAETVIKSVFNDTFLAVPDLIRGIKSASISAPILISGKTIVQIDVSFIVDFKVPITY